MRVFLRLLSFLYSFIFPSQNDSCIMSALNRLLCKRTAGVLWGQRQTFFWLIHATASWKLLLGSSPAMTSDLMNRLPPPVVLIKVVPEMEFIMSEYKFWHSSRLQERTRISRFALNLQSSLFIFYSLEISGS